MNCKDHREQLSPYADGMLDSANRAALEAHLGSCAHCSAELEGIQKVITSYHGLERPVAPNLIPGIRRKLDMAGNRGQATPTPSSLWSRVGLPAGVLAAAALIVVAVSVPLYLKHPDSKHLEEILRPETEREALFREERSEGSEIRKHVASEKLFHAERLDEQTPTSKRLRQPAAVQPAQSPAPGRVDLPGALPKAASPPEHFQSTPEQTTGLIRLQWSPSKPSEALVGLEGWLRTRPDTLLETQTGKLVVRLPRSNYPALLQEMERIGGTVVSSIPERKSFVQSPHPPAGKQGVLDREAPGPSLERVSVPLLTVEIILAPAK